MNDKKQMEKVSIFCGVCGKYLAAVPAVFQGKYRAALCRACRRDFHQTTSELDLAQVREGMRSLNS